MALQKAIASLNTQINSIHRRRQTIHKQIEGLTVKILQSDL